MNIHFTVSSGNRKTGPMLVTTQSEDTCPDCPFKGAGCYANYGPIKMHWEQVTSGQRVKQWGEFLAAVMRQQSGSLWRMSAAGDLPGQGNRINRHKLGQVIEANRGFRGFTYTHKPLTEANREMIKQANDNGFTINLSADNLADADKKAALGIAPVVVPIPSDYNPEDLRTPEGRKVVVCLHDTHGLTCQQCGLCAVAGRKSIVGFPAHGTGKRKLEKAITI